MLSSLCLSLFHLLVWRIGEIGISFTWWNHHVHATWIPQLYGKPVLRCSLRRSSVVSVLGNRFRCRWCWNQMKRMSTVSYLCQSTLFLMYMNAVECFEVQPGNKNYKTASGRARCLGTLVMSLTMDMPPKIWTLSANFSVKDLFICRSRDAQGSWFISSYGVRWYFNSHAPYSIFSFLTTILNIISSDWNFGVAYVEKGKWGES